VINVTNEKISRYRHRQTDCTFLSQLNDPVSTGSFTRHWRNCVGYVVDCYVL
jgi:hypothetical protein